MTHNGEHIDILFEENGFGGPGKYVGVENKGGCDPGLGKWIKRNDGFWALRIEEDEWPTVNYSNKTSKTLSSLPERAMEILRRITLRA